MPTDIDRARWREEKRHWRKANPDRARELTCEFYYRNREQIRERHRAYKAARRAALKASLTTTPTESP